MLFAITPSRSPSIAIRAARVARNLRMNVVMCSKGKRVKSFKALCFLGKKEYSTRALFSCFVVDDSNIENN